MEQMNLQISQILQPTLNVQIVQNNAPVVEAKIVIGGGGTVSVVFGDTLTGTGTSADPVNVSNDILGQINNNTQTSQDNATQIQDIQDLIPATANTQNQLADQGFVNSSIQTATAYFRGDWATWADVPTDPELYPVDATGNHTPTTNDYMVVIADEQTNGGTWRYKYTGVWAEQGKDGWQAEYQVNETPLTAAQLAALNSGVTAESIASFVKNTDYATESKAGVVKADQAFGIRASSSGALSPSTASLSIYTSKGDSYFIGKGTLENIKKDIVERAVSEDGATLSGYVKNTDYATSTTGGVIKTINSFSTAADGSGYLYASTKTQDAYSTGSKNMFVGKGTLENIKKDLVERAVSEDGAVLSGYVKNTDYATSTTVGVVFIGATSGLGVSTGGNIHILPATETVIDAKKSGNRAVTMNKLDYAVKVGVTTNTITLTDEEKAAAQAWLGIDTLIGDIETALAGV